MSEQSKFTISRATMEIAVAVLTAAIGVAIAYGSLENGIGWDSSGPQGGTFPFYVGVLVVGASIGTIVVTLRGQVPVETFATGLQLARMARFAAPILGFLVAVPFIGHYVASALLIAVSMMLGGRTLARSLLVGASVAVAFYLIFDLGFRVPLSKGPLENALGIY